MSSLRPRTAVLLVNLGTPDAPDPGPVRRYLREFLSDPYVLDIPAVPRKALLELVILPTRPKKSAEAYRQVWTDEGSPLLVHGKALRAALAEELGDAVCAVELGMRYGNPSIGSALDRVLEAGADELVVLPLFPQYSQSAWQSAVAKVESECAARTTHLPMRVVAPFYDAPAFLDAVVAVARPALDGFGADRVLMSFHGLPERHVQKTDLAPDGAPHCLAASGCCASIVTANRFCYRAQSYATARGIAAGLGLGDADFEVAFQSRLGRTPWIKPYTDERVTAMPSEGVRRLAVLCPSFVADCLETIEEIGMRAKEDFVAAGGEDLLLVPCVNAAPEWVTGVGDLLGIARGRSAPAAVSG